MIVCSLISGIGALDSATSGKIGLRTMCYYVGSTTIAVCEGLCWIFAVRPGADVKLTDEVTVERKGYSTVDGLLDMIRYKKSSYIAINISIEYDKIDTET